MNRRRKKGSKVRISYIWAGIMSVCALAALFAAVWVVIAVYEKIIGDSVQWEEESSVVETSELEIVEDPVTGWIDEEGGTRYLDSDGNYLCDRWIVSEGSLYYLDEDGYMAVDEVSMDGQVFSFNEEGELTDIQMDSNWVGLTGDDNLQNLDSLVKSNAFWCYLDSGSDEDAVFKTIYYRKTTEMEAKPLGGDDPEKSTHNSLHIYDGYIYYLPQVTARTFSSLSTEEQELCNRLYRMKPGDSKRELLAENATGFLVLEDGSIYYASDGQIRMVDTESADSSEEEQYQVQIKDAGCYLVDASGDPVSGNLVIEDRLYQLDQDGKITGVYPADRTYGQATFTLEQNSSGATALYRQSSGAAKTMIAQSDYGINSFCIADGMIYYSAYIRRDSDGTRYSAIFQISPDGSGNRQISREFQGNILNLYYYSEQGKIYGEYTPVSWKNCYGQIVVIELDGTVSVIDDSSSRTGEVMEDNDLLTLVMVDGNTITTYLRSCSYSRTTASWTVLSEEPYQFPAVLQQVIAASADSVTGEEQSTEEETEAESETAAVEESTVPAVVEETPSTQAAASETEQVRQPGPSETAGVVFEEPGHTVESAAPPAASAPAPEAIPTIEANPESGNVSGSVEFVGPGY